jgi:DNA-binding transcriptional LysR family regulator
MLLRNWNDLRFLLAIERGQTLTGAARLLKVDDTTVGRRIEALQHELGVRLVQRAAGGRLLLTPTGLAVARRAEAMEHQLDEISEIVGELCLNLGDGHPFMLRRYRDRLRCRL